MKLLFSLFALLSIFGCSTGNQSLAYAQIEYEAGACRGFCPTYKMMITSDRNAIFEAEQFNFSETRDTSGSEGTFKGQIKEQDYQKLTAMLNDLNFSTLKGKYNDQNKSDLPTSFLRITFSDGTQKIIEDYGKNGSPALERVYQIFDDFRTNQFWRKTE